MKTLRLILLLFIIFNFGCAEFIEDGKWISEQGKNCHRGHHRDGCRHSELKYNYYENRFEYAHPGDELKYNYYDHHWSYENPDSKPKIDKNRGNKNRGKIEGHNTNYPDKE